LKSLTAAEELLGLVWTGRAQTALIVEAGFIGVEIGLLLADLGLEVTQLVRSRVMRSMLDPEKSELVLGMMQERGVDMVRGADADAVAFLGGPRAHAVQVRSSVMLASDLLVAATGLRPNIEALAGSVIETGFGILVDDHLCTNFSNIHIAGDVAETRDRLTSERTSTPYFPMRLSRGAV
jgi:pyruvate/2-oxoglutarate dehydrogenase complex dihydrolipoamide dehydrogenase (E3) component